MNQNDPIYLYCPECHRIQAVDPMTYQTNLKQNSDRLKRGRLRTNGNQQ